MKSILFKLIFLFLLSIISIPAQTFESGVKGRIIQKQTGDPVIGANVYISGTLWGTTSGMDGDYAIKSLPAGKVELVVSIIGFETEVISIILKRNSTTSLDIELEEKVYEYGEVEVFAERPVEWENNLNKFKNLFLGTSEFANDCVIENDFVIDFNNSNDGLFSASAREPLIIKNNALGFLITCVIQNFSFDEKSQRCQYKVATNFKMMESELVSERRNWESNRQKAFRGSLHHFLKTLKVDSLFSRGYTVQISESPQLAVIHVGNPILTSKLLLLQDYLPNEHILDFPDYLRVTYKDIFTKLDQTSYLYLPYGNVTIDESGYLYDDSGLEAYGFWSTLGIADMLPKYYFDL